MFKDFKNGITPNEHKKRVANMLSDGIPTVQVGGDTLTWDGNTEGLDVSSNGVLFRVSDAIPTKDDCANGCSIVMDVNGEVISATASGSDAQSMFGDDGYADFAAIQIIPTDNYEAFGHLYPKKGIYFIYSEGQQAVKSLTIPGYTGFGEKKIAPSYLYQPDWNQNDETAADFIKNRPFGDVPAVIFDGTVEFNDGEGSLQSNYIVAEGEEVIVEWNGTTYPCIAYTSESYVAIGNHSLMGGDDTGEPFGMIFVDALVMVVPVDSTVVSASVKMQKNVATKLPARYLDVFTPLYLNIQEEETSYLYADIQLSKKVTTDELNRLAKEKPIILFYSFMGIQQNGAVYPYEVTVMNGIGQIKSSRGTHHAAECTGT